MRIKKIEWKNFASYGNRKQTLELSDSSFLFQIFGANGFGKTTISQVIAFCLYGKVEGKKLGDIPNRINGNTWTRIEFESNNKSIVIERGLEPSFFNLYIDGIPYDQAGKKNVQEYVSDDIIGIPYYVFNNTISLSINDFKSFIKMSPQDKRAIVDKIFGFHILNQMRETLKSEAKKIKEEMDRLYGSLKATDRSITTSSEEMEILVSQIEEESKNRISELNETLIKFKTLQDLHSVKVDEFKNNENEIIELIRDSSMKLIEIRGEITSLTNRLRLYEFSKCPTCEADLDSEHHHSLKEQLENEKIQKDSDLEELEKMIVKNKEIESKIKTQKYELQEKGNKIKVRISEILNEIQKLQGVDQEKQVSSLKRIIQNLEYDKTKLNSDVLKTGEKSAWIKQLDDILGEKGVKQMAIKTILPSLNSEIIDLLREMNLDFQVIFDEEFKGTIYHMGAEIPVQTLSTGEMKKVDFVVLISIMKLMKLKFSTINLLFLDELFSSVDPEGIHSILKILKKNTREMGLNVFVMNHYPMPHEFFDFKLEVSKTNGFSSISVEKI